MRFWKTEFMKLIDGDKVSMLDNEQFCEVLYVCEVPETEINSRLITEYY